MIVIRINVPNKVPRTASHCGMVLVSRFPLRPFLSTTFTQSVKLASGLSLPPDV